MSKSGNVNNQIIIGIDMKRTLIGLMVVILSGLIVTAMAEPTPGCCGAKKADSGPAGGCGTMKGGCDPAKCPMPMKGEAGPGMDGPPMGMEMTPGMGMRPGRMFGRGDIETLRGRVASIEQGPQGGMMLMVESDSRITPVFLGPPPRAEEAIKEIARNDRVEITGMRVAHGGKSGLMARDLKVARGQDMVTVPLSKGPMMDRPMGEPGPGPRPHRPMRGHTY